MSLCGYAYVVSCVATSLYVMRNLLVTPVEFVAQFGD